MELPVSVVDAPRPEGLPDADEILCDEVVETFFERIGAGYAFVFHYMPIGRSFTLELMLTPEQRLRLYERVWWLVRNRHIFIADFWNSATATNGCVAAGRAGGYFHVNWNGDVSPCVFFPYSPVNVKEVFARGGTLDEVWAHPLFADIRRWQRDYGYRRTSRARTAATGWRRASSGTTTRTSSSWCAGTRRRRPTTTRTRRCSTPSTTSGLERFGRELEQLAGPVWGERYKQGKGIPPAADEAAVVAAPGLASSVAAWV